LPEKNNWQRCRFVLAQILKICTYFAGHTFEKNGANLPLRFVNSSTGARLRSRENTMVELNRRQIFILVFFFIDGGRL